MCACFADIATDELLVLRREEERDIERREEAAMEARRHADISRASVNDSAQKAVRA